MTFKFIVLGSENTGKTSLVNRLLNNKFEHSLNSQDKNTLSGTKFMELKTPQETIKLQLYLLQSAMHKTMGGSYHRGATGYVITVDLTKDNFVKDIEKWRREISFYTGNMNPRIIIAGNKSDLAKNKENSLALKSYADSNKLEYLETSAASGVGVAELKEKFIQQPLMYAHPEVKPLPDDSRTLFNEPNYQYSDNLCLRTNFPRLFANPTITKEGQGVKNDDMRDIYRNDSSL